MREEEDDEGGDSAGRRGSRSEGRLHLLARPPLSERPTECDTTTLVTAITKVFTCYHFVKIKVLSRCKPSHIPAIGFKLGLSDLPNYPGIWTTTVF